MGKWTSVKEKLPEEHEETRDIFDMETLSDLVIVTVKDHRDDEIFASDDYTMYGEWCNFNGTYEVIAWQPLPEPYNEGFEEEETL